MCEICVNGKKLEKNNNRDNSDCRLKYYNDHLKLNVIQKDCYKNTLLNLKNYECVVVMDFKQNFKIGGGPIEISQSFYNKSSVSCLGFMVVKNIDADIKREYFNYLSEIISHDSFFVKKCLSRLEKDVLNSYSKIHFWSDNGRHFRSQELKNFILL